MKRGLVAGVVLAALALGLWLRPWTPPPVVTGFSIFALGTLMDIRIADPVSVEQRAALESRIVAMLDAFQSDWSPTRDGALAGVNATLLTGSDSLVPTTLRDDFRFARQLCLDSQGRFDPAIGRWIALWGFESEEDLRDTPPTAAEIEAARSPSWCEAEFPDAESVRLPASGARLNFGALAKGRAVGMVVELLADAGLQHVIVNAGGDLQVLGQHPQRPWHIGIRDPRQANPTAAIAALDLASGEALFSSGDYERWFAHAGTRYHHLLDPATGYPASGTRSATVLHTDPALADAAATALFVAGPDAAARVAADLGIRYWMLIDQDGQHHASEPMLQRLEWLDGPAPG